MAYCLWLFILTHCVHGFLQDNPSFDKIECASLSTENNCDILSHRLCKWSDAQSICKDNYDPIIFISAFDIAATAKSLISFILLLLCMTLYSFAGFLTRKWKIFRDVDPDKLHKCQIYIFELIGLTLCLSYLLYHKTLNIIFHAGDYSDFGPESTLKFVRSLAAFVLLMYLYSIEMLTNTMRWSLRLHHIIIMGTTMYVEWILYEHADLAALRCALCVSLYALTEHNVFIQLLLYRVVPLWGWPFHLISAILYLMTRLFVTGSFIYCYIGWAATDSIKYEISGEKERHYPYLIFFFALPIAIILINIAHFHTTKALFFVCKSVYNKYKERETLLYYPRLQSLYDIFVSFDSERIGSWTFGNFKKFIHHYSSFIKEDTCIILWNVLGFSYEPIEENVMEEIEIAPTGWMDKQREQQLLTPRDFNNIENIPMSIKRKAKMKWRHFGKIFGQHVISKKFAHHSVDTVVGAQVQILLQTVFDVQAQFGKYDGFSDKDKAITKLYADINKLVEGKKKKKTSTLPEEIMNQSMEMGVFSTTTIEMILNPTSFVQKTHRKKKGTHLNVVYDEEDDDDDDDLYDDDGDAMITKTRDTMTVTATEIADGYEDIECSTNALRPADDEFNPNTLRPAEDGEVIDDEAESYRSTNAFKGTEDLRDSKDWKISINQEDVDRIEEEDDEFSIEEEEEQKNKEMLFRIMMHGPDGKPRQYSDDEDDFDEDSTEARTGLSVMGTMQAVQKMLDIDGGAINEWI